MAKKKAEAILPGQKNASQILFDQLRQKSLLSAIKF